MEVKISWWFLGTIFNELEDILESNIESLLFSHFYSPINKRTWAMVLLVLKYKYMVFVCLNFTGNVNFTCL
jgi:hypothetical protein